MSRITDRDERETHYQMQRNRLFDIEPYTRSGLQTFDDIADDQRLKQALRRSVNKVNAPQHIIEAIRKEIRK